MMIQRKVTNTKQNVFMTRLMIYAIISLLIQGLLINCSKNHYKDTYIKNGFVYNEKLNFKMKIYGDIKQIKIDTSKNIEIKKTNNLKYLGMILQFLITQASRKVFLNTIKT